MQIVVKSLKLEEGTETSWYRSIEGRLVKDDQFSLEFSENSALNYHYSKSDGEGHLYLFSINDKRPEKVREHKLFLKFFESEKLIAQEIIQKYLMYRTKFWECVNDAFDDEINNTLIDGSDNELEGSSLNVCEFGFDFNKILNSDIHLPEVFINKEYSLPIIIPINEVKTLELLAAGIDGFKEIFIVTTDHIEGVEDYQKTVFITNAPAVLKEEIQSVLSKNKSKKQFIIFSKVIAAFVSIVGISIIAYTFIRNIIKTIKKKS